MSRTKTPRSEIVEEIIRKHPDAPARTLARKLHEDYPHEFETAEKARSAVRYRLGVNGKRSRSQKSADSLKRPKRNAGEWTLPRGERQIERPKVFNKPGRWLVSGDWHVPFHDERSLDAIFRYAYDNQIENLYLNGDAIDFYKLSRWDKDPRRRNPDQEIQILKTITDIADGIFTGIRVHKIGNHEDRYRAYMQQRAPELLGIEQFELTYLLKRDGWQFVQSKQLGKLGKLPIVHGHELPKGLTDPVNIGRGVFLRLRDSAAVNHFHRTSTHIETSGIKTTMIPCYSIGCVCDLHPAYAPINKWNHGFAVVDVSRGGNWQFSNKVIEGGEVFSA